ncbi:MAG: isoprenylcysteine carboxylmethyltransferase family protein [bacterium]|nr:isoprenylcysteine carboxylmethyltransferase family protein [bacterium]
MNFTHFYLIFLIGSSFYRVRRIIKSYSYEPRPSKVSVSFTFPIMLLLYLTVWCGAIFEYFYLTYILQIKEINLIVSFIGFLMYIGVVPWRGWAADTLGKQMSPDIKIVEDHRLIKDGPYRYMRHPLIFCAIIEAFGLALIPNSYYTLLIALFGFTPFMLLKAYLEEKALVKEFGPEYLHYKKEVYGFFPWKRVKK